MGLMLRDYKLFAIHWTAERPIRRENPHGDMVATGEREVISGVWRCVAQSHDIAHLLFTERHLYSGHEKRRVTQVEEHQIDVLSINITY